MQMHFWDCLLIYTSVSKECTVGKYGADCKEICNGHCEDNAFCNHVTGQCDGGCAVGWSGYLCDKGILNHWSKVESYGYQFTCKQIYNTDGFKNNVSKREDKK